MHGQADIKFVHSNERNVNTFPLYEAFDTPTYNKISTCSVMAEMFFSVIANNSEANSRNSLIPLLSRRERELWWSLWEIAKNLSTTGSALQNWSSTVLATFQKKKRKHFSYIHPHRSYSTGWPTRKLNQLTRSCEHQTKSTEVSNGVTKCQNLHQLLVFEVRW